ncbi:ABC transporter ATP-binding protein [Nonomuraea sp. NPDC046802]|uniref:ABC transporter ATP-binding protein n=1 Tax=Nonomuraea sp. NPDC046802 TaxID=3154919 RepID=UPI0033E044A6
MTLNVRDLSVRYGGLAALSQVSLDLADGEVLALVGESGCGKTTLARTLLGLLPATAEASGSALLGGHELVGRTDWAGVRGARVATVPQGAMTGLSPVHRVGAQLAEMLALHGGAADPAGLLERVGLAPAMLGSYPHELSGGQRQRVAIALALAGEPELLVADEPTTGLDAIAQRQILALLAGLGTSTLIVSHDLAGLRPYADRMAVMYAGRLAEVRPARALSPGTAHPYTAGLLTATPVADRDVAWGSIPGSAPALGQPPPGCAFAARCPLAADRCHEERPALVAFGEAQVACHRHAERERPSYPNVPRTDGLPGDVVVSAAGVRHTYRSRSRVVEALRDVDLEIRAGEIVGLVGESGSGKSTLARILLGLIRPTSGHVTLEGRRLTAGRALRLLRRRIGFVHQDPYDSLHPGMRVAALVAEPMTVAGVPRGQRPARVRESLTAAGLPDDPEFLGRFPGQLSGGQRQRVSIARALAGGPALLIADEATSMLDVSTRAGIATTLRALATERGLAVLLVTHDLGEAVQSCDRILVLRAGQVVEHGRTDDVARAPAHAYTTRLLEASAALPDGGSL